MAKPAQKGALDELEARIGHAFKDRQLLQQALTHMSMGRASTGKNAHYQRLEFLGDRVLGLAIAELLFDTFADANEGELSKRFAELVRKETCAEVCERWGVPPHIVLGAGVQATATRRNRNVLGDVCEAVIGAVFVDAGYDAARAVVEGGFGDLVQRARGVPRDPKTALQEWVQRNGASPPKYRILDRSGPEHAPEFRVGVEVDGYGLVEGVGPSKRLAEQDAALTMLRQQDQWSDSHA